MSGRGAAQGDPTLSPGAGGGEGRDARAFLYVGSPVSGAIGF